MASPIGSMRPVPVLAEKVEPPHIPYEIHEVTELRISVPETGRRLLPLPVAAWHATVGRVVLDPIAKGDQVLVHGQLVRRFYRSGAGARSLTEVVATGIKRLDSTSGSER